MQPYCSIPSCDRRHYGLGFCQLHYRRLRTHGDPQFTKYPRRFLGSVVERFWANTNKLTSSGCWLWVGSYKSGGYGRLWDKGRYLPAYRFAYELLVGPIPEGKELDHLCRTPACVNPEHLEPVDHRENMFRSPLAQAALKNLQNRHRAKTHCPQRHPYDLFNTYWMKRGGRACKLCKLQSQVFYRKLRSDAKRVRKSIT